MDWTGMFQSSDAGLSSWENNSYCCWAGGIAHDSSKLKRYNFDCMYNTTRNLKQEVSEPYQPWMKPHCWGGWVTSRCRRLIFSETSTRVGAVEHDGHGVLVKGTQKMNQSSPSIRWSISPFVRCDMFDRWSIRRRWSFFPAETAWKEPCSLVWIAVLPSTNTSYTSVDDISYPYLYMIWDK